MRLTRILMAATTGLMLTHCAPADDDTVIDSHDGYSAWHDASDGDASGPSLDARVDSTRHQTGDTTGSDYFGPDTADGYLDESCEEIYWECRESEPQNDPLLDHGFCKQFCPETAVEGVEEALSAEGITVIVPEGYTDLADFRLRDVINCRDNQEDSLGIQLPDSPLIVRLSLLPDGYPAGSHQTLVNGVNTIFTNAPESWFINFLETSQTDEYQAMLDEGKCFLAHEFAHAMMAYIPVETFPRPVNEGFAEFMEHPVWSNYIQSFGITCEPEGYIDGGPMDGLRPYWTPMSAESFPEAGYHGYASMACLFDMIIQEEGGSGLQSLAIGLVTHRDYGIVDSGVCGESSGPSFTKVAVDTLQPGTIAALDTSFYLLSWADYCSTE